MKANFIILTLLFTLFLSIASVTAVDVSINPTDNIQDTIDNAAVGDTITLNKGTYNQHSIHVTKELTIKGATDNPDDVIIDADKKGRVVEVQDTVNNVKLIGITFANGYYDGTWNGDGAGVSNNGGTQSKPTQIINCKFTNNQATGEGGAIYNTGHLTITNCELKNNKADGNGGGISNRGDITITGSTFKDNTAQSMGGGIYNLDVATITRSFFQENQAVIGGGILNDGEMTITDTTVQENQGSGICNFRNLNIIRSTIQKNTALVNGGGIINCENLNIQNCIIRENTAPAFGGGISNTAGIFGDSILTITGSTIIGNKATNFGGAISNDFVGQFSSTVIVNFNRIVENTPNAIQCSVGSINALYNWWGSNNPDFTKLVNGSVTYNPWLVMRFIALPLNVMVGEVSTLTADFRFDSNGQFHDPKKGHLPDNTPVTFTTNLGEVGSSSVVKYTLNGVATAVLRATRSGNATVTAGLDDQVLSGNVIIRPAPKPVPESNKVQAETIAMQQTGVPVIPLLLGLLVLMGGILTVRKK